MNPCIVANALPFKSLESVCFYNKTKKIHIISNKWCSFELSIHPNLNCFQY